MARLKIKDAPLLPVINGDEKIPTGGKGDFTLTPNMLADHFKSNSGFATDMELNVVDGKVNNHINNEGNPHKVTKEQVGLDQVNNTSDIDKPVSNATSVALDTKADKSQVIIDLNLKADKITTYTKTEVDSEFLSIYQNGAALPYDATMEYAENAHVVKDGELQKKQGASWVSATNKGYNLDYFVSGKSYPLHAEIMLTNGDIVKSTVANNIVNPNMDMMGWVKPNSASQIFDCAINRDQQNKNTDIITATDFGAKGDGTTLDTQSLKNAVVSLTSGRTLLLTKGTYLIDNALGNLPEGANIICEGGALIKLSNTAVLNPWVKIITATKDNIITVNIDGGRYNTVGITGISSQDLTGWDNVRILNCNIKNVQNAMLSIAASRCLIMGNTVTGTRNSGLLFTLGDGQKAMHNTIANNNFEDMGDTAVAFHTTFANTEMAYNIIHGNTAKNTQRITGGFAFDFEEGVGELKHHNVFSNNTVEQTTVSSFSQCGLVMGDCRDSLITGNVAKGNRNILSIGIDIFKSKRVTVSNNIVDNFRTGIHTRLTDFAKVIGNTITDCGDNPSDGYSFGAITVANSGSVSNIDIINNTIIFSDTFPTNAPAISGYIGSAYRLDNLRIKDNKIWKCQGFAIGFNIAGQADNVMIKSNEIIGADNTLSAFVKFFNTTRLRVINNTMLDLLRGVNIQQCDDVIIRANSIIDRRGVKKLERYITLGSDQGQLSTNVLIENNDLMGATLTPTLMPSADFGTAVIKNNRGFVTSNYGTTAAIPKATTITHGLNVTPKQVFLMPRGAVSGMYVSNITSTTFTINFTEVTSVVFDWRADA